MKQLIIFLVLNCAFFGAANALPSNLNASVFEYRAIIESDLLQNSLGQGESIIKLERQTKDLEADLVYYKLKTLYPVAESEATLGEQIHVNKYLVTLTLAPNPQIGPRVITVESIEQISEHSIIYHE